jgi:hypothetical protein
MGRPNSWKKTARSQCRGGKAKRDYKKLIHRQNRRKAKQNPESTDKKLDAWAFD